MRNRLFISNGPYTSLILSSLIELLPRSSKDFNILLGYFKNIDNKNKQLSILDTTFFTRNLSLLSYNNFFKFNCKHFHSHTNYKIFDSIYLPINSNTIKWYKIFKKLYPKAEFNLYEEGLLSYIKPIFSRKLRAIMKKTTNHYMFHNSYLKNMVSYYCPQIKFTTINKVSILNNIEKIKTKFNVIKPFFKEEYEKSVVILPQYYYQNNKKKFAVLSNNYINYIEQFIKQGYKVFFKDHPKSNSSLYNFLQSQLNDNNKFILLKDEDLPIEILIDTIKPQFIFSIYSTSLFTLPYLYNISALTSLKMLEERINWFSLFPSLSCILVKKIIPNIENQPLEYANVENCFKTNNKMLDYFINLSTKLL